MHNISELTGSVELRM